MSKDLDSLDKLDCLWDSEDRDFQAPCTFSKWDQSVELDFAEAFGDRELVQITARSGLLHWLFDHPMYASHLLALGLTADNAYGCLSNYLFQATPALQKQLPGDVLETLSVNTVIGIQIRYASCHHDIEGHMWCWHGCCYTWHVIVSLLTVIPHVHHFVAHSTALVLLCSEISEMLSGSCLLLGCCLGPHMCKSGVDVCHECSGHGTW